jgi:hypothetical protein
MKSLKRCYLVEEMMKIKNLISELLIEGKIDDLQEKYPNLDVQALAQLDPTPQKKYIEWIVKQTLAGGSKDDIGPTIDYFHKNNQRFQNKDINSYKTLKSLEDVVKDISQKKTSAERRAEKKEGSYTIFEDDDVNVIFVGSKESCQTYGAGTKWCITMRDLSYYEQYTSGNTIFYFILSKKRTDNKYAKVAIAVERGANNELLRTQYFDQQDATIREQQLQEIFPSFPAIKAAYVADAGTQPKNLLAKMHSGEATFQEEKEAYDIWKGQKGFDKVIELIKTPEMMQFLLHDLSGDEALRYVKSHAGKMNEQTFRVAFSNPSMKKYILKSMYDIVMAPPGSYIDSYTWMNTNTLKKYKSWVQDQIDSESEPRNVLYVAALTSSDEILKKLAASNQSKIRRAVIANENVSQAAVDIIANHPSMEDEIVRDYTLDALFRNKSISGNSIRSLFNQLDYFDDITSLEQEQIVLFVHLVNNPNTPSDVLEKTYDEFKKSNWPGHTDQIFQALLTNKNLPTRLLIKILNDSKNGYDRVKVAAKISNPELLNVLSNDELSDVVLAVAGNRNTPPSTLAKLATTTDKQIRDKIANNLSTPIVTLRALTTDKISHVRQSAKITLNKKLNG